MIIIVIMIGKNGDTLKKLYLFVIQTIKRYPHDLERSIVRF